jgi:tRNA threonylcarbamoyladenosine biosynthesis protein TsaB
MSVRDPNILCIETSTEICSVAICKGEYLIASFTSETPNSHSEKLTLNIMEVLRQADMSMNQISAIAVSHGPGSYTSLRVGVSTAKALCYSCEIPLIAIDSLEILVSPILNMEVEGILMPMIDARRMEVYTAIYKSKIRVQPLHALIIDKEINAVIEEYGKIHLCGSGADKCFKYLGSELSNLYHKNTDASYMCFLASEKYYSGIFEDVAYYNPEYLKGPNITTSQKKFF